jgi:hypothetical protein
MRADKRVRMTLRRTRAKNSVRMIAPKYAVVNGNRGPDARCRAYVMGPMMAAKDDKNRIEPTVHNVTNLLGRRERAGRNAKQITKQAKGLDGAGNGAPGPSVVGRRT